MRTRPIFKKKKNEQTKMFQMLTHTSKLFDSTNLIRLI